MEVRRSPGQEEGSKALGPLTRPDSPLPTLLRSLCSRTMTPKAEAPSLRRTLSDSQATSPSPATGFTHPPARGRCSRLLGSLKTRTWGIQDSWVWEKWASPAEAQSLPQEWLLQPRGADRVPAPGQRHLLQAGPDLPAHLPGGHLPQAHLLWHLQRLREHSARCHPERPLERPNSSQPGLEKPGLPWSALGHQAPDNPQIPEKPLASNNPCISQQP